MNFVTWSWMRAFGSERRWCLDISFFILSSIVAELRCSSLAMFIPSVSTSKSNNKQP